MRAIFGGVFVVFFFGAADNASAAPACEGRYISVTGTITHVVHVDWAQEFSVGTYHPQCEVVYFLGKGPLPPACVEGRTVTGEGVLIPDVGGEDLFNIANPVNFRCY